MQNSRRFWISFAAVTIFCAVFQFIWNEKMSERYHLPNAAFLLGLLAVSVAGFHVFLQRWAGGSPQVFVRSYMVNTVLRFFFYILLFGVFLFRFPMYREAFVVHFLLYYILFTSIELRFLFTQIGSSK